MDVFGRSGIAQIKDLVRLLRLMVICSALLQTLFAQGINWDSERVDQTRQIEGLTGQQFAIDGYGVLHVVYGGFRLHHEYRDAVGWHKEIIDMSENVGAQPSLVIDADDRLHVVYLDQNNASIKYAYKDADGWIRTSVDGSEGMGELCSLGLDSNDQPRIMCWGDNQNGVVQLVRTNDQWETSYVLATTAKPNLLQLRIDDNDVSHACISVNPTRDVLYLRQDDSAWPGEVIGTGWTFSFALDDLGDPHIVVVDIEADDIRYLHPGSGGWISDVVMEGANGFVAIELDDEQRPHIAMASGAVFYATRGEDEWIIETAREHYYYESHGVGLSLVLDQREDPHLCYITSYDNDAMQPLVKILHHSWEENDDWFLESIEGPNGHVGRSPSLAIDSNGHRHLAYCSFEPTYAYNDGDGWRIEWIEDSYTGKVELAVDSSDIPHMAYQSDGALKHAWLGNDLWLIETIDDTTGIWSAFAMTIDDNDIMHVSYHRDGLLHAVQIGEKWIITEFDPDWLSPFAIQIDAAGRVHIGYVDVLSDSLGYGLWDGVQWIDELIAACRSSDASMVLDNDGNPHMSYTNDWLNYAVKRDGHWSIEMVDDYQDYPCRVGDQSSIALNPDGEPHISYSHYCQPPNYPTSYDGYFAFRSADGWHLDDSIGGSISDLKIDLDAVVHVAIHSPGSQFGGLTYYSASPPLIIGVRPDDPRPFLLAFDGRSPAIDRVGIVVSLPHAKRLNMSIFDLMGREIAPVFQGYLESGHHRFEWDCLGFKGFPIPNGTYILSAEAGGQRVSKRIVVIR